MKKIAVFPGSFDPLTNGHLDVIKRSSKIFDEVIVAIGTNTNKNHLFSFETKLKLIKENIKDFDNVSAFKMDGLTANFAKEKNANYIVRGVRNGKDYEYERDIAEINKQLNNIETVLLFANPAFQNISSSMLKEVAFFSGDISNLVPENVSKEIIKLYKK